eukprot:CAMPEP_0184503616 /NCGR_PEP_ID=MMETSP0113_2-20130426/51999_1 /TAXON_ID=91329 /ORGANISM="Norrisiella sphaerica, Strain BC52" /LENGTH=65 /DNA_ID=CAMNT_0026893149 /DNA_START=249 /DNA_END=446 /DNA_ORIENTATION=+
MAGDGDSALPSFRLLTSSHAHAPRVATATDLLFLLHESKLREPSAHPLGLDLQGHFIAVRPKRVA